MEGRRQGAEREWKEIPKVKVSRKHWSDVA